MTRFRFSRLALALSLSVSAASAFHVDWDARAGTTWTENIGRSSRPTDWRDALSLEAGIIGTTRRTLAPNLTAALGLGVEGTSVPDYDRLSHVLAGPRVGLSYKAGLGPYVPVLSASGSANYREGPLHEARGWIVAGEVAASQRVTDQLKVVATGEWQEAYARQAAFTNRYQRLRAELVWDVTSRWQATAGYGKLWGDVTANASWPVWGTALGGGLGPAVQAYYRGTGQAVTNIFAPGWVSYRVKAEVTSWWLGLSPALTDASALALRYENNHTVNKVGVAYQMDQWSLSYLYRF